MFSLIESLLNTLKKRPLVCGAIGLCAGVMLGAFLSVTLGLCFIALCFILLAFACNMRSVPLILLAVFIAFGVLRTALSFSFGMDGRAEIIGRVYDVSNDYTVISSVTVNGEKLHGKVRVDKKLRFDVDDTIKFTCTLINQKNAGDSYSRYLLSNGTSHIATNVRNISFIDNERTFHGILTDISNTLANKIDYLFPKFSSFIRAILLGDTDLVESSSLVSIRNSGVAHIFALSGLHVNIICSALLFALQTKSPKSRFYIMTVFLILYCGVTAFPPSLMRASFIMFCSLFGKAYGYSTDSLNTLSISAIVLLIINPYMLFDVGFVLSYSAAMFLALGSNNYKADKLENPLLKSLISSSSATLGTLTPSAYYFGRIAVFSPIVNLIAIPLSSVALLSAFIAVPLGFISDVLSFLPALVANAFMFMLLMLCELVNLIPFASVEVNHTFALCQLLAFLAVFSLSRHVIINKDDRIFCSLLFFFIYCAITVLFAVI